MVRPMLERTRYRRLALVSGLLLAILLLDLTVAGAHASVWVFVIALLLSGLWVGVSQARGLNVGAVASSASRRRTNIGTGLALVFAATVAVSGALDVERSALQDVLAVTSVGVAAFVVGLSLTVLRRMPRAPTQ